MRDDDIRRTEELARQDVNYRAKPEENARKRKGAAESGAVGADSPPLTAELAEVIEAWPTLSEAARAAILKLIRP